MQCKTGADHLKSLKDGRAVYIDGNRADYASETKFLGRSAKARANGLQPFVSRFIAGMANILLWPAREVAARRELEMLAGMSEYELKDIGLTAADVADVTALPADVSPTNFLAGRVEERQRARHEMAGRVQREKIDAARRSALRHELETAGPWPWRRRS
jgi:uncharacterized protein YjiS (DUF1127 family)